MLNVVFYHFSTIFIINTEVNEKGHLLDPQSSWLSVCVGVCGCVRVGASACVSLHVQKRRMFKG